MSWVDSVFGNPDVPAVTREVERAGHKFTFRAFNMGIYEPYIEGDRDGLEYMFGSHWLWPKWAQAIRDAMFAEIRAMRKKGASNENA